MDEDLGWSQAWSDLQLEPPAGEHEALLAAYREPHRHYHTLEHIRECFGHLTPARYLAQQPAAVTLALWFHDAVYVPRRSDNEALSAAWAARVLQTAGASDTLTQRITAHVLATKDHLPTTDADTNLVLDIDLAILGAPPERFALYEAQIQAEYSWVPGWLYRRQRKAVLQSFLKRLVLYQTEHFRQRFENNARNNLTVTKRTAGA